MFFKQYYLGCLAHASYYIGSGAEAAIVDPQRDVAQYLDEAEANNQQIKYVIETHLHADFVSGHLELAKKTGAKIVYGFQASGCINNGNFDLKELAIFLGTLLNVEIDSNLYGHYSDIKSRKVSKTRFINTMSEKLIEKIEEDDDVMNVYHTMEE